MEHIKKPVEYEVQAQNQLEKDYENTLESGGTMKIHISVTINENKSEDFRHMLKKMAECSHNFYLELGVWLKNPVT